jgi:hypothetical protein
VTTVRSQWGVGSGSEADADGHCVMGKTEISAGGDAGVWGSNRIGIY